MVTFDSWLDLRNNPTQLEQPSTRTPVLEVYRRPIQRNFQGIRLLDLLFFRRGAPRVSDGFAAGAGAGLKGVAARLGTEVWGVPLDSSPVKISERSDTARWKVD